MATIADTFNMFHRREEPWQGKVMTVHGLIPAEAMGITLPHEHFLVTHQGPLVDLVDADLAINELQRYKRAGGRTVVDMTSVGIGRDPLALKTISSHTGVNVVMGTGYYKDAWLPPDVHEMSVEEMAQVMVMEIAEGVGDTGVHAGVIGEIGVSRPITRTEEKVLAASARAQQETGTAISVHFDLGDIDEHNYALDILEDEGADLNRVVVEHVVSRPDAVEHCKSIAARGCYVEFELWGMHLWPKVNEMVDSDYEAQIASLRWFIVSGLLERILISQDICCQVLLVKNGGFGYAHILNDLVPKFKSYGITDEEIYTMMVDNPKRLFPFQF
jgi:phosphotriesterase-related protein